MQLKKYPYKNNIKKVVEKYISLKDMQSLLKPKGILISATKRVDIANLTKDYYLSQNDFQELKQLLDSPNNFKKIGRIILPANESEDFKESLSGLNGRVLDPTDNTKINIGIVDDNKMTVYLQYEEQRPGLVELLETKKKNIVIDIENSEELCNVNYSISSASDYKKVKELLNYIQQDSSFTFKELLLSDLKTENRTELFTNFFVFFFDEWKITKITQIKKKKDTSYTSEELSVSVSESEDLAMQTENQLMQEVILDGINSALLSGENLIENSFINKVLTQGFYFSMSFIRFENKNNSDFLDFVIEFKTRPERLETKIIESGEFVTDENQDIVEIKRIFSEEKQNQIIYEFNDILGEIFMGFSQPQSIEVSTQ
ncbi:hypothetical protein [Exiguobacterium profundum]|uniref:hypothetical protein n=1 Tax=Exiguobacterium profundum TaxID=307643 RepID=UPI00093CEBDB|nr:hypothetical protein [Exiguobacterium profundum]